MLQLRTMLALAASLYTTLWLFALLAVAVAYFSFSGRIGSEAWVAVPLFLLAANLLAAVLTKPAFRQKPPLLAFHLGLLVLLLLVAAGRLTYLRGEVEVTEGEPLPQLTRYRSGIFHHIDERAIGFTLDRFDIEFDTNQRKRFIRSEVHWRNAQGNEERYTIADMEPLIQGGYRFYSTRHKGFAPIFHWQPDGEKVGQIGAIHLPSYPEHQHNQAQEWTLPTSGTPVWAMLQFDEVIITPGQVSKFRSPSDHFLVVRSGDVRAELRMGESVHLPGGKLTYRELRTWMGFVVFHDWTMPWLLVTTLFCVLSLGWHYWRKFAAKPWLQEETN